MAGHSPAAPFSPQAQETSMADEPLLNLDTLFRRSTIAVDGVAYELFSPDELSVMASHQFGVWGRRIEALGKSDNAANGVELGALMDKAAGDRKSTRLNSRPS